MNHLIKHMDDLTNLQIKMINKITECLFKIILQFIGTNIYGERNRGGNLSAKMNLKRQTEKDLMFRRIIRYLESAVCLYKFYNKF